MLLLTHTINCSKTRTNKYSRQGQKRDCTKTSQDADRHPMTLSYFVGNTVNL